MRRDPRGAAIEFAEIVQEALNVLGVAKVTLSPGSRHESLGLTVNRDDGIRQGPLRLEVRMTISVMSDHDQWIVRTNSYQYGIHEVTNQGSRELLEFHWDSRRAPHVHVRGGKDHVPTGRVLLEDVIEYCVSDLGWSPRQHDWREILTATRAHFQINRHWD